jgi:WD40 repeat protein
LKHPRKSGGEPFEVTGAGFCPDGNSIVTACGDGTARIWNLARSSRNLDQLQSWIEMVTGLSLDDEGIVHVLDTNTWSSRRRHLMSNGVR